MILPELAQEIRRCPMLYVADVRDAVLRVIELVASKFVPVVLIGGFHGRSVGDFLGGEAS